MKKRIQKILNSKYKDELTKIARELGIPKYHSLDKGHLVSAILKFKEPLLRKKLSLNWWACYQGHVYGFASIFGLVSTFLFFVIQQNSTSSAEEIANRVVEEIINSKMQMMPTYKNPLAEIANRRNISENELHALLDEYAESIKNDPAKNREYIRTLIANGQYEKAATEAGKLEEYLHKKRENLNNEEQALRYDEAEALSVHGLALLQLGKIQKALQKTQRASDLMVNDIGHRQWFETQKLLAFALATSGRVDEALPLYLETYNKEKDSISEEGRFEYAFNLGFLAYIAGDHDRAETFYTSAFHIAEDNFTRTDHRLAIMLLPLSQVALEKRNYPKAEDIGRRYLGRLNETGEINSVYAGAGFYNLAKILRLSGQTKDAFQYYNLALDIYIQELGEEHLQVALTYNDIGLCKMAELRFSEAIEDFDKAISMARRHNYGDLHISMYTANRGRALILRGQFKHGRECFEQALELRKKCLPANSPLIYELEELLKYTHEFELYSYRQLYRQD